MRKPIPTHQLRRHAFAALLLAGAVLWTAGCATSAEVQDIVAKSNAQLLASNAQLLANNALGLNPLRLSSPGDQADDWKAEVARIDATIDNNAGQDALIAALRVRQAMLITVHQQDNLALATWDLVEEGDLHSERDKALYDVHKELVWWFKVSGSPLNTSQLAEAEGALAAFDAANEDLAETSDVRVYLEEMRAWIALAAALGQPTGQRAKAQEILKAGLTRFASIVQPDDVARIKELRKAGNVSKEAPRALRLALRAPLVVKEYRAAAQTKGLTDWGDDADLVALLAAVPEGG